MGNCSKLFNGIVSQFKKKNILNWSKIEKFWIENFISCGALVLDVSDANWG